MNKWLNFNSSIINNITSYYVIDKLNILEKESKSYILINKIIPNKQITLLTSKELFINNNIDLSKLYSIISKDRLINISAHTITHIPVNAKLWYYYYYPFIIQDDYNYLTQIFTSRDYEMFLFNKMFENICYMLDNNISDKEISWSLTNDLKRQIIPYYYINSINKDKVELYKNGTFWTFMPNYFNELSDRLFRMKFCNIFYRDGVPYNLPKSHFSRNGIFPTNRSTSIFSLERKGIVIYNWSDSIIDIKEQAVIFNKSANHIKVYLASYNYITYRKLTLVNMEKILSRQTNNLEISKPFTFHRTFTIMELTSLYYWFRNEKDYAINILNYLANACLSYEKALHKNKLTNKDPYPLDPLDVETILQFGIGMHWGMPMGLYKEISKLYNNTLECFATSSNHFLDNYCDPIRRSFFNLFNVTEDCLLCNPPFTEVIIRKCLFQSYLILTTIEKKSIYIFLPLWFDLIHDIMFINLFYKFVTAFPKSIAYDFKTKKNIKTNIKQQLVFLTNKELTENDNKGIRLCILYLGGN